MIPSAEDVLRWWPAIAARYERLDIMNDAALRRALTRASVLAADDDPLEPAALFVAFAERRADAALVVEQFRLWLVPIRKA